MTLICLTVNRQGNQSIGLIRELLQGEEIPNVFPKICIQFLPEKIRYYDQFSSINFGRGGGESQALDVDTGSCTRSRPSYVLAMHNYAYKTVAGGGGIKGS